MTEPFFDAHLHVVDLAAAGGRVEATGFIRGDLDVGAAVRAVHRANPRARSSLAATCRRRARHARSGPTIS